MSEKILQNPSNLSCENVDLKLRLHTSIFRAKKRLGGHRGRCNNLRKTQFRIIHEIVSTYMQAT